MAGTGRMKGDGRGRMGGRQKGTTNKVSREVKEAVVEFVNGNSDRLQEMMDNMVDPKDWINAYIRLLEFVMPKKAAVNISSESKVCDLRSELEELANKEI